MFFYSNENIQSNAKVKNILTKKNNRKQINKPGSGTLTLKKRNNTSQYHKFALFGSSKSYLPTTLHQISSSPDTSL